MAKKKLCFVIMPFSSTNICTSEQWTEIFNNVHKPDITFCRHESDVVNERSKAELIERKTVDARPIGNELRYETGFRIVKPFRR